MWGIWKWQPLWVKVVPGVGGIPIDDTPIWHREQLTELREEQGEADNPIIRPINETYQQRVNREHIELSDRINLKLWCGGYHPLQEIVLKFTSFAFFWYSALGSKSWCIDHVGLQGQTCSFY